MTLPPIRHRKRYVLRHKDGRYYSFVDWDTYDSPQFSRDWRDAKQMTAAGCSQAKKMLEDPKRWGEPFERIAVEDIPK